MEIFFAIVLEKSPVAGGRGQGRGPLPVLVLVLVLVLEVGVEAVARRGKA
jgi:hypothetical protein